MNKVLIICVGAAMALPAQTLTTLYSFDKADGYYPAGMVQATDGNLYGVATSGGATGSGTIFRLTPDGTLTTLYQFCGQTGCPDGTEPYSLLQASDGNLYGATASGGANQSGTVFRFTLTGALTTVYNFCSQSFCSDGATPIGGLIQGTDGNLYGTTTYGGNFYVRHVGYGTVFKMTLDGTLTTLHRFCRAAKCPDGAYPYETLMQAANGNIYGTTTQGGDKLSAAGTVFEITPDGKLTTKYKFLCDSGCPDGYAPMAGLTQAANGDLYSTTSSGGRRHGGTLSGGTVFRMTPPGALKTIATFDCFEHDCPNGIASEGSLIVASDGNLYGTAGAAGPSANNEGTVFRITPEGELTTVYSFCSRKGCADGRNPAVGLIQATNGDFYGTTGRGGATNDGTVFRLSLGLGPFVQPQIAAGSVGSTVNILGTSLTGATGVTFNGAAAQFTVVSPSLIVATVPSGATTGTIQVETPGGTLSSSSAFRVIQ